MESLLSATVVVGNLKPASRTLDAAVMLATKLMGAAPATVIDVIGLGPGLLRWGDPAVGEAVAAVQRSGVVVFASPTYKATFTGVLKLFLDQIPSNGLAGVVAIPMMLGAGLQHALAPELLLKPVLVELGATCPTRAVYQLETGYRDEGAFDDWLAPAAPVVAALAAGKREPPER